MGLPWIWNRKRRRHEGHDKAQGRQSSQTGEPGHRGDLPKLPLRRRQRDRRQRCSRIAKSPPVVGRPFPPRPSPPMALREGRAPRSFEPTDAIRVRGMENRDTDIIPGPGDFPSTHWSMVARAREALRRCEEALSRTETEELLHLRAFVLHRLGKREEAAARVIRGNLLALLGRYPEATSDVDEAERLSPGLADAALVRGILHICEGEVDLAIPEFERATRSDPSLEAAWRNLGAAHAEKRRCEEAVGAYSRSIQVEPSNAEAYEGRAMCRMHRERLAEALQDLDKMVELIPENPRAWTSRAVLRRRLKNRAGALEDADRVRTDRTGRTRDAVIRPSGTGQERGSRRRFHPSSGPRSETHQVSSQPGSDPGGSPARFGGPRRPGAGDSGDAESAREASAEDRRSSDTGTC